MRRHCDGWWWWWFCDDGDGDDDEENSEQEENSDEENSKEILTATLSVKDIRTQLKTPFHNKTSGAIGAIHFHYVILNHA